MMLNTIKDYYCEPFYEDVFLSRNHLCYI